MDQSIIEALAEKKRQEAEAARGTPDRSAEASIPVAFDSRRPWLRLLARGFDILLFSVAAEAVVRFVWPNLQAESFWLVGVVPGVLLYLLADALLMRVFGSTPGKYLLKIHVIPDNWGPITMRQAIRRSVSVGSHGLAFGLPIANVVALFCARKRLLKIGKTRWDEKGHFYVLHQEMGILGPVALLFFSALLLLVAFLLASLSSDRRTGKLPEYRVREDVQQGPPAEIRAPIVPPRVGATVPDGNDTETTALPIRAPHTKPDQGVRLAGGQAASEVAAIEQGDLNRPAAANRAYRSTTAPVTGRYAHPAKAAGSAPVTIDKRSGISNKTASMKALPATAPAESVPPLHRRTQTHAWAGPRPGAAPGHQRVSAMPVAPARVHRQALAASRHTEKRSIADSQHLLSNYPFQRTAALQKNKTVQQRQEVAREDGTPGKEMLAQGASVPNHVLRHKKWRRHNRVTAPPPAESREAEMSGNAGGQEAQQEAVPDTAGKSRELSSPVAGSNAAVGMPPDAVPWTPPAPRAAGTDASGMKAGTGAGGTALLSQPDAGNSSETAAPPSQQPSGSARQSSMADDTPGATQQASPVAADISGVPTDFEQSVMQHTTGAMVTANGTGGSRGY